MLGFWFWAWFYIVVHASIQTFPSGGGGGGPENICSNKCISLRLVRTSLEKQLDMWARLLLGGVRTRTPKESFSNLSFSRWSRPPPRSSVFDIVCGLVSLVCSVVV